MKVPHHIWKARGVGGGVQNNPKYKISQIQVKRKQLRGVPNTHVLQDIKPMVTPLYHIGQFLGFAGSSSSSQSTSKSGSVVPVVPSEVLLRERAGPRDTIDICCVSTLSGSRCSSFIETVSAVEPFEGESGTECPDGGVGPPVVVVDMAKSRAQRFDRQKAR